MAGNQPRKKARMIDDFDDDILIRMISCLDLKSAISTSSVSHRWKPLWTLIPELDLGIWNQPIPDDDDMEVPNLITHSLLQYRSLVVQKFRAFFHNHLLYVSQAHIDSWVLFCTSRGVRDINISFFDDDHWVIEADEFDRCLVPRSLLRCTSLEVLNLSFFDLPNSSLHLPLLKVLELHHVRLSAALDTSGCPLLQRLLLHDCSDHQFDLNILAPNPSLQYLLIHDIDLYPDPQHPHCTTIRAPNLLRIEFTGCVLRNYNVSDLSLLESARFSLHHMDHFLFDPQATLPLVNLLHYVHHAPTLNLCQRSIQILSLWESKGVKLPQFEAGCIKLETNLCKSQVTGMAFVLGNAPKMEKLIVDISGGALAGEFWSDVADSASDVPVPWKAFEESLVQQRLLKVVEVNNLMITCLLPCEELNRGADIAELLNRGSEVELLRELAASCSMLEKLVIRRILLPDWALKSEYIPCLKRRLEKSLKSRICAVSFP